MCSGPSFAPSRLFSACLVRTRTELIGQFIAMENEPNLEKYGTILNKHKNPACRPLILKLTRRWRSCRRPQAGDSRFGRILRKLQSPPVYGPENAKTKKSIFFKNYCKIKVAVIPMWRRKSPLSADDQQKVATAHRHAGRAGRKQQHLRSAHAHKSVHLVVLLI